MVRSKLEPHPQRKKGKRPVTTFKDEWNKFLAKTDQPSLKEALSSLQNVFFDEEAVTNYISIRLQLSDLCSAHASATFQHYVESCRRSKNVKEKNHKKVDISSFILDLEIESRKQHIERGSTGLISM